MKAKLIQIEVKVPLDAETAGRKEMLLAEMTQAQAAEKDLAKLEASGRRANMKKRLAAMSELAEELVTNSHTVMVDAEERPVFATNEVQTVRLDTHDIVSTRAMSAEERQVEMELDEKEPEARHDAKIVKITGRKKKVPEPPN